MKASGMLSIVCAFALCAVAACSDSSQPAGPGSTYNRAVMTAQPDDQVVPAQPDDRSAPPAGGEQKVLQRPITDFLSTQGSYCIDDNNGGCRTIIPPVPNYFNWFDGRQNLALSVDYTGMTNSWLESTSGYQRSLGTQVSGNVSEQLREDGRTLVTVDLNTTNAVSFVARGPRWDQPIVMGYQPLELMDERSKPALGIAHLHLVFVNGAFGAKLPDLNQLILAPEKGQELLDLRFQYDGDGSLRENGDAPVHISVSSNDPLMEFPRDPMMGPMGAANINLVAAD